MSHRRLLALIFLLVALFIVVIPLIHYWTTPVPAELRDTRYGGQIVFGAPRALLLSYADCMDVYWNVEGIRAVKVADEPVTGTGDMTVCGRTPRLDVTFQNGVLREYSLDRQFVLTSTVRFLYAVATVLVLLAVERWTGPWQWTSRLGTTLLGWSGTRWFAGDLRSLVRDARRWFYQEDPLYRHTLLAIIVLGFVLRLLLLNHTAGHDEINTYYQFAAPPLWIGLPQYPPPNNHFFNTLLIHILSRLFGIDLWVMRLPVFVLGVLTIPATYAAGRVLYNSTTGIIAATLVAVIPDLIVFSTNARGYIYVTLFFLLLLVLAHYVARRDNRAAWTFIGVLAVLGFYTLPTMFYTYGAVALWLLGLLLATYDADRSRRLRHFFVTNVAAGIVTVVLYMPVFLRSGVEAVTANAYVDHYPWEVYLQGLPELITGIWTSWTADPPVVLALFLVLGILVGIAAGVVHKTWRTLWLLAATFGWIAAVMTAQRVLPFVRVFSFLLPLVLLVAGYGWSILLDQVRASPRIAPALSMGLALTLCVLLMRSGTFQALDSSGSMQDAPGIALYLKGEIQSYDTVITNNRYNTMRYYFDVNQMDTDYIWFNRRTDTRRLRRLFVLVERNIDTIDEVFESNDLQLEDYYPFEKVYQGDEVDLYRSYYRVEAASLETD